MVNSYRGHSEERTNNVKRTRECEYTINKYRALLTRAREGMVIWVPLGDEENQTRSMSDMDRLADYLVDCGAQPIGQSATGSFFP